MAGCQPRITETNLGTGWATTSINAVYFRTNSVVSDENWQFAAYCDSTYWSRSAGKENQKHR